MIGIEISGTLPQFQEPKTIMQNLAIRVADDIKADIISGGYPNRWKNTIFGAQAQLSFIARTMKVDSGDDFAQVSWGGTGYAKVHEKGMSIPKTPAMRAMMWKKLREKGFKWTKGMVRPMLDIPQRSAIQGVIARKEKYAEFLGKELTITQSVTIFKGQL